MEPAQTSAVAAGDDPVVKTGIENQWNYSPEMAEACPQRLAFRVRLQPDGTVQEAELVEPQPLSASCKPAAEAARRAILKASPLQGTKGVDAIVVRFDYSSLL